MIPKGVIKGRPTQHWESEQVDFNDLEAVYKVTENRLLETPSPFPAAIAGPLSHTRVGTSESSVVLCHCCLQVIFAYMYDQPGSGRLPGSGACEDVEK